MSFYLLILALNFHVFRVEKGVLKSTHREINKMPAMPEFKEFEICGENKCINIK